MPNDPVPSLRILDPWLSNVRTLCHIGEPERCTNHFKMWKFRNFLLLRFYVKSKLEKLKVENLLLFSISKALELDFWKLQPCKMVKFAKKSKFRASITVKNGNFRAFVFTKIAFTLNMRGRKISKFPHCDLWTLW